MFLRDKLECLSVASLPNLVEQLWARQRAYHYRGASFRYPIRIGSNLSQTYLARLERLASENHSSLLRTCVKYGRKKF
jgi:hypothetical protein